MLEERIAQFRARMEEPDVNVKEDTRAMALELLRLIAESYASVKQAEPVDHPDGMTVGFVRQNLKNTSDLLTTMVDRLRDSLGGPHSEVDAALLAWVQGQSLSVGEALRQIDSMIPHLEPTGLISQLRQWQVSLRLLQDRLTVRLDTDALRRRANELVERTEAAFQRAQEASSKAQDAAGLAGNASLGTYFSDYAEKELIAARWFRGLTIAAIILGLGGVLAQGHLEPADWTGVTFRVAIAAGAGTLAAYFGRQSGQHRRLYNWARSTEVQLESFPAFIEGVPAEEQGEVYRTLARRVLSAPPEKEGDTSEDSVGSAQLLDIVATLARRQLS
ncbi:hypothetical protein IC744_02495 [Microbacterium hominis]|uniref:hypothetical protein n=1 Tax=Microbacterium TaxID=33882 RepID=UPI00168A4316|nr:MULTISPECIES: hypothetical protein [Microbacterium]QOC25273.1 hypothetical protein IC745_13150 [Microbacterium hominis]QOC29293.1 hypothetical protein IC744_02495 [Microbacterium hominis]QYF98429.1 hypothetical protein KY498_04080 [Microbacterium sp. PAMC21962]